MADEKPNLSAEVTLAFGDGEYLFKLDMKRIEELQEKCGAGLGAIFARVTYQDWRIQDIYETIRLGAIGGGADPVKAKALVDRYVDGCPLARPGDVSSPVAVAKAILGASVFGVERLKLEQNVKKKTPKKKAPAGSTSNSSADNGSSSRSTPPQSKV